MIKQKHFQIFITHVPTNRTVTFDGWVTGFSDTFSSAWGGTKAYGRMDDHYNFERTGRKISLAFDVIAADKFEAAKNIRNMNRLTQFLYPRFAPSRGDLIPGTNSQVLNAAPLLKIKWNGLISNSFQGGPLVGFLDGFRYQPDIAAGQFFVESQGSGKPFIAYQNHAVQLEYTVLHTHQVGWSRAGIGGEGGWLFGGDSAADIGATYPHAISDAMILPKEGPAADEVAPEAAGHNPLPYDDLEDNYIDDDFIDLRRPRLPIPELASRQQEILSDEFGFVDTAHEGLGLGLLTGDSDYYGYAK